MVNKNHKDDVKAKDSKKILPVVAAAVVLVCAAILIFTNGNEPNDRQTAGIPDDTQTVITQGESLVIPISEITDEASFFPITVDGEDMEVLAVRSQHSIHVKAAIHPERGFIALKTENWYATTAASISRRTRLKWPPADVIPGLYSVKIKLLPMTAYRFHMIFFLSQKKSLQTGKLRLIKGGTDK